MFDLSLDRCGLRVGITGIVHLVGQIGIGPYELRSQLVETHPLRFIALELFGVAALVGTEEARVSRGVVGRLYRLAQGLDLLAGFLQPCPALLQPILHQALDVLPVVVLERPAGVVLDGPLQ